MNDLMPICVQYNIFTDTGYEETYEIETKISVSELTNISCMVNDHFDTMSEYLNEVGNP
jgi:hypothetical protein